jgi:hypothetical protein
MMSGLRYVAAGAMALGVFGTIFKRRKLDAEHVCVERGICAGCSAYEECRLPRALSRKQVIKDSSHAG